MFSCAPKHWQDLIPITLFQWKIASGSPKLSLPLKLGNCDIANLGKPDTASVASNKFIKAKSPDNVYSDFFKIFLKAGVIPKAVPHEHHFLPFEERFILTDCIEKNICLQLAELIKQMITLEYMQPTDPLIIKHDKPTGGFVELQEEVRWSLTTDMVGKNVINLYFQQYFNSFTDVCGNKITNSALKGNIHQPVLGIQIKLAITLTNPALITISAVPEQLHFLLFTPDTSICSVFEKITSSIQQGNLMRLIPTSAGFLKPTHTYSLAHFSQAFGLFKLEEIGPSAAPRLFQSIATSNPPSPDKAIQQAMHDFPRACSVTPITGSPPSSVEYLEKITTPVMASPQRTTFKKLAQSFQSSRNDQSFESSDSDSLDPSLDPSFLEKFMPQELFKEHLRSLFKDPLTEDELNRICIHCSQSSQDQCFHIFLITLFIKILEQNNLMLTPYSDYKNKPCNLRLIQQSNGRKHLEISYTKEYLSIEDTSNGTTYNSYNCGSIINTPILRIVLKLEIPLYGDLISTKIKPLLFNIEWLTLKDQIPKGLQNAIKQIISKNAMQVAHKNWIETNRPHSCH